LLCQGLNRFFTLGRGSRKARKKQERE